MVIRKGHGTVCPWWEWPGATQPSEEAWSGPVLWLPLRGIPQASSCPRSQGTGTFSPKPGLLAVRLLGVLKLLGFL